MAKALPFSFLLQSAALLSPSAVCAALGVWQLQRREWKAGELAKRAQRLLEPPLPLSQLDASTPEWRRVRGEGELVTEAAAFVRHSRDTERGVRPAVTDACTLAPFPQVEPVRPAGGGPVVLLNRGWVPSEWREARLRDGPAPACVRVSGVVRRSERPSSFVPPNDPPSGAWYWVDAQAMARAQQLPPSTPLVEAVGQAGEGAPAGAYPQPSVEAALLRFPTTPGDHANYAATWLTLSAAIGGLAGRAIRARARSLR